MSSIRKKAIAGLKVGDRFSVTRRFSQAEVNQFAALSRDYNPVHFDQRFTQVKNIQNPVCHGLLVASLITEIGGQIGWLASGMSFKFKRPVYFDCPVRCDFTLVELDQRHRAKAKALFFDEAENIVLEAELTGILPGPEEQRIMQAMVDEGDPTNKLRGKC